MTSTPHTPPSEDARPEDGPAWAGPWASDAQRLFRMLSEGDGTGHQPDSHATAAECRYCPLCQGMAMIRRQGPEILDRVAELAAGLAATLRATAPAEPDAADPSGSGDPPRTTEDDPGPERPPIPKTVRIDITD